MSKSLLLLAGLALYPLAASTPAAAETSYPWCASFGGAEGGVVTCGYSNEAQCVASIQGNGGSCFANPAYALRPVSDSRRQRHG